MNRRAKLRCFSHTVLLAVLFFIYPFSYVYAEKTERHNIDLIYIDANTAGSSGGHAALRVGDYVYHYQHYPSGLFLPVREKWKKFRRVYNDLENRTLYINRITVPEVDFNRIDRYFRKRYLAMELHMENLSALEEERSFIEACSSGNHSFAFKGAGFFSRSSCKETFFSNNEIAQIKGKLKETEELIRQFKFDFISRHPKPSSDIFPRPFLTSTSRYIELIHYSKALRYILESRKVKDAVLLDISIHAPENSPVLNEREITALEQYRHRLKKNILNMMESCRQNIGWPLMLAFARMQAVTRSLLHGRIIMLDPFSDMADFVDSSIWSRKKALGTIYEGQYKNFIRIRKEVFNEEYLDENSYNLLENSYARLYETARHIKGGKKKIRVQNGLMIPDKRDYIDINIPFFQGPDCKTFSVTVSKRYEKYREELEKIYSYSIVSRNCVTELIEDLYKGLGDEKDILETLGAYINPYSGLFFVPFVFDREILTNMSINRRIILPSYRNRVVKRICSEENLFSCLKEASTITSAVYQETGEEYGFLFFTDNVVAPRPILGALNMGYGILYAGSGIFTLPFDNGEMIREGLFGTFFSIPELFFFNIRKGAFSVIRE